MLVLVVSAALSSLLFIPLLVGAATAASASQEKTKITKLLATGVQIGHLREYVAKGMGFYEAEGLDVTLQPAPGSATQIQYMIAGKGSFGSIDMHMAVELQKKGNVRLVSPYAHFQSGVYRIGTLDALPIKRVGDLKESVSACPRQQAVLTPFCSRQLARRAYGKPTCKLSRSRLARLR